MSHRRITRIALVAGALGLVALTTACQPEPLPAASGSAPAATTSPASPSAEPSASPTDALPEEEIALPAACDAIYSPDMLTILQSDVPPLNDPGTTMISTQNVDALEILEAAPETLRCSWGPPSERGIATNVTIITDEQRNALFEAFTRDGFSAEDLGSGTIHTIEQEMVTQDDAIIRLGESHYLGGNGWVSTRWINVLPDGYTRDIVSTLWAEWQ